MDDCVDDNVEAYRDYWGDDGVVGKTCMLTGVSFADPRNQPVVGSSCQHTGWGYERRALMSAVREHSLIDCLRCGKPITMPLRSLFRLSYMCQQPSRPGDTHETILLGGKRPATYGDDVESKSDSDSDSESEVDEGKMVDRVVKGRYSSGFQEASAMYGNMRLRIRGQRSHLTRENSKSPTFAPRFIFQRYLLDCVRMFHQRFPFWLDDARNTFKYKIAKDRQWRIRKQDNHRAKKHTSNN